MPQSCTIIYSFNVDSYILYALVYYECHTLLIYIGTDKRAEFWSYFEVKSNSTNVVQLSTNSYKSIVGNSCKKYLCIENASLQDQMWMKPLKLKIIQIYFMHHLQRFSIFYKVLCTFLLLLFMSIKILRHHYQQMNENKQLKLSPFNILCQQNLQAFLQLINKTYQSDFWSFILLCK